MKNIILIISVLLMAPVFIIRGYTEETVSELDIMTIEGKVSNIDSVGKKIVVECFSGNLTFNVPENTKIMRTGDEIMLDDIDQGDLVTVEYHRLSSGILETITLTDNNVGYE